VTNQELERRLADAISRTAPNDLEGVLSHCEMRKGNVIPMTTRKKNPVIRNLIAACLALALVGGGGGMVYQQAYAVTSIVSLDVNPSIELEVNKKEKVLTCQALNEEAREVLADMNGGADLEGTKLDVAVNAIVGALVRNGYLDSISSAILISVEDKDQTRAAKLQQELTAAVDMVLQEKASDATVLSQTVEKDVAVEKQAKENNISTGKASLISRVMALNSSLKFEKLSALSVEELKDLLETGAPGMPIGKDAAVQVALKHAGALAVSAISWEVDAELDDSPAHYEVELFTPSRELEFEYEVDAYTGGILKGKADVLKQEPVQPAKPTDPVTPSGPVTPSVPDDPKPSDATQALIGETKAFDIAAADFYARYPELSGSNILNNRVELDRDDGRTHYDVEFWLGGYEVDYEIDGETGRILSWDTDYEGPVTKPEAPAVTDVGESKAKAAAFAHAGVKEKEVTGLQVKKDYDDGRLEYEIEFWAGDTEYDYTISGDGSVLEFDSVYYAPSTATDIGKDKAKSVALAHAGLIESQVTGLRVEKDEDDGRVEYEIEFKSNGMEYEYTIDAATGSVLEHEKDRDD